MTSSINPFRRIPHHSPDIYRCITCLGGVTIGRKHDTRNRYRVLLCKRCGTYFADEWRAKTETRSNFNAAGYVRLQNRCGIIPILDDETLETQFSTLSPRIFDRIQYYLEQVIDNSERWFDPFHRLSPSLEAAAYCESVNELKRLTDFALDAGYIKSCRNSNPEDFFYITIRGLEFLEKNRANRSRTATAFVAMWFSDEMLEIFHGAIEPAIKNSGYEPHFLKTKEHANHIDDEIVAGIRECKFLIAELTGHRGGVYYESGLAHGLGKPVVFCCRESDSKGLHFDVRQFSCIRWTSPDELLVSLQTRIVAAIGRGPGKS